MGVAFEANELLYLAMLCGAKEVFGISNAFYGKTDEEIRVLVDKTVKTCCNKDFVAIKNDGTQKIVDNYEKSIRIVSEADSITELIVRNTKTQQIRYLVYKKGKERIILFESGGEYFMVNSEEFDKVRYAIQTLFSDGCLVKTDIESFSLLPDEVNEAMSGKRAKANIIKALLHDKGVDNIVALLVTEGVMGRAGYFSAATINCSKKDVKSSFFLSDSGITLQIATNSNRNIVFTVVDNESAKQKALSYLGGDFYV